MRMVYGLDPIVFDPSGLSSAMLLIHEAASFKLVFMRPTDPIEGQQMHRLAIFRLEFRNGTSADVEGVYFWKFRDSIPPAFGNDDVGYLDANPYGDGPTEDLARRVRLAHDAVMRPATAIDTAQPPLFVNVDCDEPSYKVTNPFEITSETRRLLAAALRKRFARIQAEVDVFAGTCLAHMVEKGQCHYEFRPEPKYPTMLRNTQVFTPWPENTMEGALDGLLGELCPMDSDWGPTPSLGARIAERIVQHADDAILSISTPRSAALASLFRDLGAPGGQSGVKREPDIVLEVMRLSTHPNFAADVLYETWKRRSAARPAREFLPG